jgi:hypothetical protein
VISSFQSSIWIHRGSETGHNLQQAKDEVKGRSRVILNSRIGDTALRQRVTHANRFVSSVYKRRYW